MKMFEKTRWEAVLGMNARNARVEAENPLKAIQLVNSKHDTKAALEEAGVPVAPTLVRIRDRRELSRLDWDALPEAFALKPNYGRGGAGILLAKDGDGWSTLSGRPLSKEVIKDQIRSILEGEYSLESVEHDSALLEPLIVPHPVLARLVPSGLPDIRVICHRGEPLLAMMRLPTEESEGRANLHQGAVGAAVDLGSGRVARAMLKRERIEEHPDTGEGLLGVEVPEWGAVVEAAARCAEATGLGYLGADVVVDEERGPLVLEVNARPGLEIQNVAGVRLADLLT